jgi:hypothetical protein
MTELDLSKTRLAVYDIALADAAVSVPGGGTVFFYLHSGSAQIEDAAGSAVIAAEDVRFIEGAFSISGQGLGWLYEFAPADRPFFRGAGISLVMSRTLPPAFEGEAIMRADRVESPRGGQTPRHGHRGPGIRRLLSGCIHASMGGDVDRIGVGQPWFEKGKEWVFGTNAHDGISAFVRVMILPAELAGGLPSLVHETPEEAAKPRAASYRLYGERPARLGL